MSARADAILPMENRASAKSIKTVYVKSASAKTLSNYELPHGRFRARGRQCANDSCDYPLSLYFSSAGRLPASRFRKTYCNTPP